MHLEHEDYHKPRSGKRWWQTRNGIATALLLAIVVVYLVTEHLMHNSSRRIAEPSQEMCSRHVGVGLDGFLHEVRRQKQTKKGATC